MITVKQVEEAGGYSVILADPPWQYNDSKVRGGAERHYPVLSLTQIMALPVERLAARDAALFLWGCYPMTAEAFAVMIAWGFRFKTLGFQWVKTTKSGTPATGLGHWTRGNSEPCWLATRGKPTRLARDVAQVIATDACEELICAPRGQHSSKPPEVRDRIVRLLGDVPRLELFARERAPGWDCWGNEVVSDLKMEVAA